MSPPAWFDPASASAFVNREVRLLNEDAIDDWMALFDADGFYFMPLHPSMDDPERYDALVYDNRALMAIRAQNNRDPASPSLERPVTAVRQVTDVHLRDADPDEVRVGATFTACIAWREQTWYAGRYLYALRHDGRDYRIRYKRVYLVGADQPLGPIMAYL